LAHVPECFRIAGTLIIITILLIEIVDIKNPRG